MTTTRTAAVLVAAALASVAGAAQSPGFVDVLDVPAKATPLSTRSLLQSVVRAGDRLIAVGQRGHILISTDGGANWKQSPVPVSSDLTAAYFVDDRNGWVVGHDGVVLRTSDGGERWESQLDGRRANDLLVAAMERNVAAAPQSEEAKQLLEEAKRYREQGPDKPFLDVWFADASNGYVVGAYNLIFRTTDGGKTWEPWFDRTENPKFYNLYAIRPAGDALFIAGEAGVVLKLDTSSQRFRALKTPYNGSYFGITGSGNAVIAFGLRGNVYRSDDAGATWSKVDAGLSASVVAAGTSAQGATLLADMGGRVVESTDGGRTFRPVELKQRAPLTGIADAGNGRLVLVGPRGAITTEAAR